MLIKFNGTDDNPLGRAITSSENSWLASLSTLGACIGALIYGALSSKFGRKTLLVSLGFPFLIFYLVMAWAKTIWLFYISRFFTGFGLGGVFTIIPIYSAELADVNNRGILGASMTVFVNIGMLIPYCVGPFIPFFWFHIVLAAIPAAYILLFIFFAPESPHFIIQKDHDAAEKILVKLRGSDEAARHLALIETELENVSNATLLEIFKTKSLCKALLIGLGGFTFMQLTGTVVVASYTQTIFETAGGNIPPEIGPI
ncbi:hypothetical protein WA026_009136 [Henosepilachna vigintioctopunctata]|uniref:Major facilitator superfamily (MFS) profile domain-containing protein n=1 Tax=Henosepilachna vigintioctopunctata TaxID=420089 RepID=A0AAW1UY04_9CUCU